MSLIEVSSSDGGRYECELMVGSERLARRVIHVVVDGEGGEHTEHEVGNALLTVVWNKNFLAGASSRGPAVHNQVFHTRKRCSSDHSSWDDGYSNIVSSCFPFSSISVFAVDHVPITVIHRKNITTDSSRLDSFGCWSRSEEVPDI